MIFRACSVQGIIYGNFKSDKDRIIDDPILKQYIQNKQHGVVDFFTAISVCHTLVPDVE